MLTPTDPASRPASAIVERFGRYELCVELASGGMATIYLARATGAEGFFRLFAVKRIHPHLAKEQAFVDMFLDEARIAARIDHPNICQVLDFGREGGTSFIAMEYLSGEPLSRVQGAIARGQAPEWSERIVPIAATLVAEACEGLHAAHELRDLKGEPLHVVHRDVSPQNVFLTFDGVVKVVDFGIASARDKVHETDVGEVKGKFAYMAPEQMLGAGVDRRADVWALGVMLWELLTTKRLFRRETQAETIAAVQHDPIPAPSSVRPGVPAAIDAIALRALERDRERRYPSARALGRDLVEAVRELGDPIGRTALADWMDALFPDGRARRAQLVELAAEAGPAPASSAPASRAVPQAERAAPRAVHADATTHAGRLRTPRAAPVRTPRRLAGYAALAALAAAIGFATYVLWPASTPDPEALDRHAMSLTATAAIETSREPSTDEAPVPEAAEPEAEPEPPLAEPEPDPLVPVATQLVETGPRERSRRAPSPPRPPGAAQAQSVEEPSGEGCLNLAMGVSIRVDAAATVEGPRRCFPVSAGTHQIAYLDPSGAVLESRTVSIASGGSVRIVAP